MIDDAAAPIVLRAAPKVIEAWYRDTMLIAEQRGRVVGFLAVDESRAEITSFYVAAPGNGIGTVLMAAARRGRARLSLWTCQANEGARRFYLRAGFREGQRTEGENDEGLPDVEYRWKQAT
ncbi:MAG: GNAT family N-acetyltransferase, partial [Paracoccus sp. (in: a-proteobacteria)]|nr:GNAT family N-acetyltransferase [Paracoccus sp. (in: a-proteobacteria)]